MVIINYIISVCNELNKTFLGHNYWIQIICLGHIVLGHIEYK